MSLRDDMYPGPELKGKPQPNAPKIYGNELEHEEFQLAPDDREEYYSDLPMSAAELEKRGLIAERKCVKWKWVIRKK